MKRLKVAVLIALVVSLAFPAQALADPGSGSKLSKTATFTAMKAGKTQGGVTPQFGGGGGSTWICTGLSNNPHRSTHPATYGNITAEGTTSCTQTMATITASARLFKEFAFVFWQEIAYDPKTNLVNSYVQANPGVPCPGSLNYKIETFHEATGFDNSWGYAVTSNTLFVSC